MPEFLVIFLAAVVVLAVLFGAYALPGINFGPSGAFVGSPSDSRQHVILAEDMRISSTATEIAKTSGTIFKGFLKEEGLILPFKTDRKWWTGGLLEFTVTDHSSAELVFLLNGNELYREKSKSGPYALEFSPDFFAESNVFEARAETWDFFTEKKYSFEAVLYGLDASKIEERLVAPKSWRRAQLLVYFDEVGGELSIELDGKTVWEGEPDGFVKVDLELGRERAHTIGILPAPRSRHFIDFAEVVFEK